MALHPGHASRNRATRVGTAGRVRTVKPLVPSGSDGHGTDYQTPIQHPICREPINVTMPMAALDRLKRRDDVIGDAPLGRVIQTPVSPLSY